MTEKFLANKIDLELTPNPISGDISTNFVSKCSFCDKYFRPHINTEFCNFCYKHRHHTKIREKILIISFKNVFEYFYVKHYLPPDNKIWFSDIMNLIKNHEKIGNFNSLFSYDYETMYWFINFSDVFKHSLPISLVIDTINELIDCLPLKNYIPELSIDLYKSHYEEEVVNFYHCRSFDAVVNPPILPNTYVPMFLDFNFSKFKEKI